MSHTASRTINKYAPKWQMGDKWVVVFIFLFKKMHSLNKCCMNARTYQPQTCSPENFVLQAEIYFDSFLLDDGISHFPSRWLRNTPLSALYLKICTERNILKVASMHRWLKYACL